ncbi:UDP-glucose 4-epimerase GalE [Devosia sp. A16]|uniref:UDP-glucose 4-epimerase GalE n=1 Tax=Devosia sp. A16 TaxID=1736675 RepID=UPI0006D78A53|nr:UDP-glucose 4-epimerase GalE [Devosia sp. A16]
MRVAVIGGAGYIGSHAAKALAQAGHEPVVIDNLSTGHREAVRWGPLHQVDIRDRSTLEQVFASVRPDAVMHFAALAYVGDSMRDPLAYYDTNVAGTVSLLQAMRKADCSTIVFSSSCATYGIPDSLPITEASPQRPTNPYGETKLACERLLHWNGITHGTRWMALRYFNAAGADPDGEIGETHEPEPHLIPLALRAAAGTGAALKVMGTDYPTPDGTALRDYVHVSDLAEAHVLALQHLVAGGPSRAVNLGTGTPHSVLGVIRTVEAVTGRSVPHELADRRPGDPPELWADAGLARSLLSWVPRYPALDRMVETAWSWTTRIR